MIALYAPQSDGTWCIAVVDNDDCHDLSDDSCAGLPPTYWVCVRHRTVGSKNGPGYRLGAPEGEPFLVLSYYAIVGGDEDVFPKRFPSLESARAYARRNKWSANVPANPWGAKR